MASKLYPSLEEFYQNNNIDYGDEDIWYSVSDQKLYRTRKRAANKSKDITDNLLPQSNININNAHKQQEVTQIVPSAPPLEEISWDDLVGVEIHPDYSLITDNGLPPYTQHDPLLNDSWVDDLLPDYDDDYSTPADYDDINVSTASTDGEAINANILCYVRSTGKSRSRSNPQVKDKRPPTDRLIVHEIKEQNVPVAVCNSNSVLDKPSGRKGDDYHAWVKWRKQVNRQLAALILLRRGGHVRLQTVDLSRKPLSKTSMKEVFQRATNDNTKESMTSLNGKPYIMYGIPRVALSKSSSRMP